MTLECVIDAELLKKYSLGNNHGSIEATAKYSIEASFEYFTKKGYNSASVFEELQSFLELLKAIASKKAIICVNEKIMDEYNKYISKVPYEINHLLLRILSDNSCLKRMDVKHDFSLLEVKNTPLESKIMYLEVAHFYKNCVIISTIEDIENIYRSNIGILIKYQINVGNVYDNIKEQKVDQEEIHIQFLGNSPKERIEALEQLVDNFSIMPDKQQAWNDLHRLTNDEDRYVRSSAADALGSVFSQVPDKQQAWNDLHRLTNDEKSEVRNYANHSLGRVSIFKASQAKTDEDYKKELEKAIEFFENAALESFAGSNPSKFCLPFYRSFHTIIFKKQEAKEEVNRYLEEAKAAIEGSESKKLLFEAIENLAEALKEVESLENLDLQEMKGELNFFRKYCDHASELMRDADEKAPYATEILRKGLPILDRNLKELLEEIHKKAEIVSKELNGTEAEEIACVINKQVQKWQISNPDEMTQKIDDIVYIIKTKVGNLPENEYILNKIEAIKNEKDLIKQYETLLFVISQIPTMKIFSKEEIESKLLNIEMNIENLTKESEMKYEASDEGRLSTESLLDHVLLELPKEELEKFSWLGVLANEVKISPQVAATLWSLTESEAFNTLRYFENKSLLFKTSDRDFPNFQMHASVHSLAISLLSGPKEANIRQISGLGLKLAEAHTILLERYRSKTTNGVWQTLPDDGYIYNHLFWHMDKAGWTEELQNLLQESSDFETSWQETNNLHVLEYSVKKQVILGNYEEAKEIMEKIMDLSPENGNLIKSQFCFLNALLDAKSENELVDEELSEWRKNVWCILSDNTFKLEKIDLSGSKSLLENNPEIDSKHDIDKDKKLVVGKSPQKAGEELEEAVMKLLENDFFKIADEEWGWNKEILRRQNSGFQGGHDIYLRYKTDNRHVTCLIECKNEKETITLDKFVTKLLQAKKHNKDIDHWILLSPYAQVSNDMEGENLGSYLNDLQKYYPFKIHVWDRTRNLKELFGLCPDVFDQFFNIGNEEIHPRKWKEEKRHEIFRKWAEELKPWILLPDVWEEYTKDPSLILFKNERMRELQFEQLYDYYIPMKLMDERRNVLDEAIEKYVKEWLGNKEIPILFLLGEFGDGKSSFTYILSRKLLEKFNLNPSNSWIPIRFALREYSKFENTKFDYPSQDFLKGRLEEFGADLKSFYKLMGSFKNILIILDGFDETSKKLDKTAMERNRRYLVNCCEEFKGLKVIVTSRPHFIEDRDYKKRLFNGIKQANGECCIYHLAPIKREKATKYLEKKFKDKPGSKEKLNQIKRIQDPIDLLSKPLFIQMMDEIFDKLSDNKLSLVKLYNMYVEKSLDDKCEFLGYDDPENDLYIDLEKTKLCLGELLERIAIELHNSKDDYVSLKKISSGDELKMAEILWNISNQSNQECLNKNATTIVAIRSLLTRVYVEDENIEWPVDFCHRSMREFFVAKAIYRALSENLNKAKTLFRQLTESLNPEILYFISELIKENDEKICDNILKIVRENKNTDYPLGKVVTLLYQVKGELPGEYWCNLNLDYIDLTGANLTGKKFIKSTLRSSRLYNVNFEDADFTDCELTDAKFGDTKPVLAATPRPSRKKIIVTYGDSTITQGSNIIAEWDIYNKLKPEYQVIGENKNGFISCILSYSGDDLLAVTDEEVIFYDYNNNNRIVENSRFKIKKEFLRTIPKKENILVIEKNEAFNKKVKIIGPKRTLLYSEEMEDGIFFENLDQNVLVHAKTDSICLINIKSKKDTEGKKLESSEITALSSFCMNKDKQYLMACGQKDGEVKVWKIDILNEEIDYKLLMKNQLHEGIVTTLSFLDDSRIISGGIDRKVNIVMFDDSGENLKGNIEHILYSNIKCRGMKIDGLKGEKERQMLEELILKAEKS